MSSKLASPNRPRTAIILSAAVAALVGAAPLSASIVTYTSRSAWMTALNSPVFCSDYENEIVTFPGHATPWTTVDQWVLTTVGPPISVQVIPGGLVNGSQELHFRDFGSQVRFTPPAALSPMFAFGFDFDTAIEPWELNIAGNPSIPLPSMTNGFIGVISTGALPDFVLTSPSNAQGGISIDDLCVPVPPPGSAALLGLAGLVATRRRRTR